VHLWIGQDPVDQTFSLLEKNITSESLTAGRDLFLPATRIVVRVRRATGIRMSTPTVHNKPKACHFKSRRLHKGIELTVHHKSPSNDLQSAMQKTKDPSTRTLLKFEGELWCSGRTSSSCSTRVCVNKYKSHK